MRIVELLNNITLPITNEESEVLDMLQDNKQIFKSDLDSRQQLIANQLVNKDVLLRIQENGRITYRQKAR
jgi:hypothetical protein